MASGDAVSDKRRTRQSALWVVVQAIAIVLFLTTAATLLARYHWVTDLLANLRLQQCFGLIPVWILFLLGRRWGWTIPCVICLAVHLPWFFHQVSIESDTRSGVQPMTITCVNVFSQNRRYEDIVSDVLDRQPDVIVILELNTELAAKLHDSFASEYGDSVVRPMDDGNFGIGLYSRHPIDQYQVFQLTAGIDSIDAKIRVDGHSYRIFATHPVPPMGPHGFLLRNEHLQQLAEMIREIRADDSAPIVLVGDLNVTPWSPHFQALQTQSGLRRATVGINVTPTWYRYPAFPLGLVLDHAMISDQWVCTGYFVGPEIGSDHRSITVTLTPIVGSNRF